MIIENYNRCKKPMIEGYYPSKYPLKISKEIVLDKSSQYLISVSYSLGKGDFKIFTSLSQNKIELICGVYLGVPLITLKEVLNGEITQVSWRCDVVEDSVSFVIQITGEYVRVFNDSGLILQEPFVVQDQNSLSLFNICEGFSDSVLKSIRIIEGSYSDSQILEFIEKGLFEYRYSTKFIRENALVDFNQSTMSFDRWESQNDVFMLCDNSFPIEQNKSVMVDHGSFIGMNPYTVLHKPKESGTVGYSKDVTGELVIKPFMSGISNMDIAKILYNDGKLPYRSVESVTLSDQFTIALLYWSEEEGDIVTLGDIGTSFKEISFDDNNEWSLIFIQKSGDHVDIYYGDSLVGSVDEVPSIEGLISFNSVGGLAYFKVIEGIISVEDMSSIKEDPFYFDYSVFPLSMDFNRNTLSENEWGDAKSSLFMYPQDDLEIDTIPQLRGVGRIKYKNY